MLCREVRLVTSESEVDPLQALPNIGAEVALRLREVGIRTPDGLRRLGSVEAAVRLAAARPDDPPCRSMLSGLEGAIRGGPLARDPQGRARPAVGGVPVLDQERRLTRLRSSARRGVQCLWRLGR